MKQSDLKKLKKEVGKHIHLFCDEYHGHSFKCDCYVINEGSDDLWFLIGSLIEEYETLGVKLKVIFKNIQELKE